ncbi:MAG: ATP synthase gamma chain [Clostridia bacterium 41_269]|nr:MAG: ATP synthase gamma chain [Clostridia bacterium 41_269]
MAQSTRDIKRRIRSIKSTQKITKAMEMVAAAKLRRAQEKAVSSRPYSNKMQEVLGRLTAGVGEFKHPLLSYPEKGKIGFVVITGDRGLAGGYNINILRLAQQHIDSCRDEAAIIALGRKGRDYFRYRNYPLLRDYINIGDIPTYIQARELAKELMELFTDGTLREVHLLFNEFISPIQQKPTIVRLLPVETEAGEGEGEEHWSEVEYIFEPSPAEVLGELLPRHIEIQVYHALLEAKASEHGARMTAMGNATDNAQEIIDKLILSYNRARQAAITKEISEIVGGAEALKNM